MTEASRGRALLMPRGRELVDDLPVNILRVSQDCALGSLANDSPRSAVLDDRHIAPGSPPRINLRRQRAPNRSLFTQSLQVTQQLFVGGKCVRLQNVVRVNNKTEQ